MNGRTIVRLEGGLHQPSGETFLRMPKVSANHIFEIVDADHCVRVEGIWIIHRDKPARHVPFVPTCLLVGLAEVVWGLIVLSEVADIASGYE